MNEKAITNNIVVDKELTVNKIKKFLKEDFTSLVWFDWDLQNYYVNKLFDLFWDNFNEKESRKLLKKIEQWVEKAVDDLIKSGYLKEIKEKLWLKTIYVRDSVKTKDVYLDYPIFYKIHLKRKLSKYILEHWLYKLQKWEVYISGYDTYWAGSEPYKYEVLNLSVGNKGDYKIVFNF